MKRRSLIRTLELPKGANPRALAESLTEDFNVASISGSNGAYEVQMVSPDELVVVINAARAQFFLEPRDKDDEDEDEDDEDFDENEDQPHDIAEEMSFLLARQLGLERHPDDDEDEDVGAPDDDHDDIARRVVARLLEDELLELVTPRSRASVEGHLAHCLAQGKNAEKLCDELADVKGVAELYASNEQFADILAACRKKRGPSLPFGLSDRGARPAPRTADSPFGQADRAARPAPRTADSPFGQADRAARPAPRSADSPFGQADRAARPAPRTSDSPFAGGDKSVRSVLEKLFSRPPDSPSKPSKPKAEPVLEKPLKSKSISPSSAVTKSTTGKSSEAKPLKKKALNDEVSDEKSSSKPAKKLKSKK